MEWLLLLIVFLAVLWLVFVATLDQKRTDRGAMASGRVEALASEGHPTLIRVYTGAQQQDAVPVFEAEAEVLARHGYSPTSQSWAQGQWGCGAFLVALLLAVVLVGILIIIYMLIVKPYGSLTVTYELREADPRAAPAMMPKVLAGTQHRQGPEVPPSGAARPPAQTPESTTPTFAARLAQLDEARRAGVISEPEYLAKRQEILSGF